MKNKMSVIETIQLYILRQTIAKHAKTLKNKDFNENPRFGDAKINEIHKIVFIR